MAAKADGNLTKHRRAWCRFWRAFAQNRGVEDPWGYDVHKGCACLEAVQQFSAANAAAKGNVEQHSVAKEARMAMNFMWSLADDQAPLFTEAAPVKQMFISFRRTAPLQAAYADTWDGKLIFYKAFEMAERGQSLLDLTHWQMRPWLETLLKLRTGARSGDLAPTKDDHGVLYRHFWPEDKGQYGKMGLRGDWAETEVEGIRFWRNKTQKNRHSHYGKWHALGPFLQNSVEFPHMATCCPRALLNKYLELTEGLPRWDELVFISKTKLKAPNTTLKKHRGISSQTVANDVGAVMTLCGVPARFRPHSTRHVKLSSEREQARLNGTSMDDALGKVDVSADVFKLFYDQPFSKDKLPAGNCELPGTRKPRASMSYAVQQLSPLPPPVPDSIEVGEVEWVVQQIVDKRSERGVTFYKVRYAGYESDDDTWEPLAQLACDGAIADYEANVESFAANKERRLPRQAPRRRLDTTGTVTTSNPKVVAAHRARSTRQRVEPDRLTAGASVYGDMRAERALAMADARNVSKAVAASLSPAGTGTGAGTGAGTAASAGARAGTGGAQQAPPHVGRAGRIRAAPMRFAAGAAVPGDCEDERRLVAAQSASRRQARPTGARPPRAAASTTRSLPARRGSATPHGDRRPSKRRRVQSGSRYSACPQCGSQVAMILMNHHMDSGECSRSLSEPHEVD